jgi:hypothetical protein
MNKYVKVLAKIKSWQREKLLKYYTELWTGSSYKEANQRRNYDENQLAANQEFKKKSRE